MRKVNELRAAGHFGLLVDVVQVNLHRALGDEESLGNVFVRAPLRGEALHIRGGVFGFAEGPEVGISRVVEENDDEVRLPAQLSGEILANVPLLGLVTMLKLKLLLSLSLALKGMLTGMSSLVVTITLLATGGSFTALTPMCPEAPRAKTRSGRPSALCAPKVTRSRISSTRFPG